MCPCPCRLLLEKGTELLEAMESALLEATGMDIGIGIGIG
jgi:hypothetical protein